jgi:hypothetical protein
MLTACRLESTPLWRGIWGGPTDTTLGWQDGADTNRVRWGTSRLVDITRHGWIYKVDVLMVRERMLNLFQTLTGTLTRFSDVHKSLGKVIQYWSTAPWVI